MVLSSLINNQSPWHLIECAVLLLAAPLLLFPAIMTPLALGMAALLIFIWFARWFAERRPLIPPSPLTPALAIWLVMIVIGTIISADPVLTLPKATGLLLGFAVWRFTTSSISTVGSLRIGVGLFFLLGLGLITVGFFSADWSYEVAFIEELFSFLPPQLISLPDGPTGGVHTNQLAEPVLFFCMVAFSLAIGVIAQRVLRFRALIIIGTAMVVALLLLTQSRSAWVGAVGGVIALLVGWATTETTSRIRNGLVLSIGVLLFCIIAALVVIGPERIQRVWDEPPRSSTIGTLRTLKFRQEVWLWSFVMIEDVPFTGIGLGSFRQAVHRLYPIAISADEDIGHAHNTFLQVALDTGVIGLIAYIAILIGAACLAWRVARQSDHYRPISIGLLSGLVAMHVYGLTDSVVPGSKTGIIFWLTIALITSLNNITSQNTTKVI